MAKILVVEDDFDLCSSLQDLLEMDHHKVDTANTGAEALQQLKFSEYDLLLLDWNLPDMQGVDICKQFRANGGACPVLMLTGKGNVTDKIIGLDSGADDYLTKPFHPDELASRIKALLRRPGAFRGNELKVGGLVLEPGIFRATIDGQEMKLLPKEFALLEFMMRHPNEVFSTEALIARVWESDSEVSPEVVRTYINRLRNKIGKKDEESMLKTVHGLGYKLQA
jgi:two-component system OmpR family response regulator